MGSPHWTTTEMQSLVMLYPDTSNAVLSRVFNRPAKAIGLKARSMGLKKSAKFMAEESGRIRPGQSPWNKGEGIDGNARRVPRDTVQTRQSTKRGEKLQTSRIASHQ